MIYVSLLIGPEDTDHAVHARLLEAGEGAGREVLALHLAQVDFQAHLAVEGGELHRHAHELRSGTVSSTWVSALAVKAPTAPKSFTKAALTPSATGGRHLSDAAWPPAEHEQDSWSRPMRVHEANPDGRTRQALASRTGRLARRSRRDVPVAGERSPTWRQSTATGAEPLMLAS